MYRVHFIWSEPLFLFLVSFQILLTLPTHPTFCADSQYFVQCRQNQTLCKHHCRYQKSMSFSTPWNNNSILWNKYSILWKNHSRLWNSPLLSLLAYMCACCLHYVMFCITVVNASSVSNVGNIYKFQ